MCMCILDKHPWQVRVHVHVHPSYQPLPTTPLTIPCTRGKVVAAPAGASAAAAASASASAAAPTAAPSAAAAAACGVAGASKVWAPLGRPGRTWPGVDPGGAGAVYVLATHPAEHVHMVTASELRPCQLWQWRHGRWDVARSLKALAIWSEVRLHAPSADCMRTNAQGPRHLVGGEIACAIS